MRSSRRGPVCVTWLPMRSAQTSWLRTTSRQRTRCGTTATTSPCRCSSDRLLVLMLVLVLLREKEEGEEEERFNRCSTRPRARTTFC